MKVSKSLRENIKMAQSILPIGKSFDLITRELSFGSLSSYFIAVNGLFHQELLQRLFSDLQNPLFLPDCHFYEIKRLMEEKIGCTQVSESDDWDLIIRSLLSGPCVLFFDGYEKALIIDTRSYPSRGIAEPENEKVLRGAKDGFVETMLFNANMIRRRIRSPKLTFEISTVGDASKTDVSIAYMQGLADNALLGKIREKLSGLNISSLTMGTKSLEGLLLKKRWFHPLPSFYVTERPDVACSYLMEGYILLMIDTTPSVLILPCSVFQFTQSPEDYYKPPILGNYIRLMRFFCIFASQFLMPVFLLFAMNPTLLPAGITLLPTGPLEPVRIFIYVLLAELLLDLFKYSSAHTPGGFSGAIGMVGGLLIGDVAVKLEWASTEVIFYAAATLLATLSLSHYVSFRLYYGKSGEKN